MVAVVGEMASSEPMDIPAGASTRARPAAIDDPGGAGWETGAESRGDGDGDGGGASVAGSRGEGGNTASPSPPFPPFSPPTAGAAWGGARSLESSPMRWVPRRSAIRAQKGGPSLLSLSLAQEQPSDDTSGGGGDGGHGSSGSKPMATTSVDGGRGMLTRQLSSSYPPSRTLTAPSFARSGGRGGGRGGGGRDDWRKSFVLAATSVNKKAEYLHGCETPELNDVLAEAVLALERGIKPDLTEDGLGGTYFVKSRMGKPIAVFKPRDEEPLAVNNPKAHAGDGTGEGLNEGVNVGEASINEYLAFLVDQSTKSGGALRAGVCPTALVRMAHSTFHAADEDRSAPFRAIKDKVGSFQLFAQHDCTAEDMGSSKFLPEHVHPLAVLDIRLCNTDRHPGNILVRESRGVVTELVPIDHGYALPGEVGSAEFEWLHWPAAKKPFSEAARTEILAIDVEGVNKMLKTRLHVVRAACLDTLAVCTTLLQRGVAAGLTAYDIGTLMTRPYCRMDEDPQPSQLEMLVAEAKLQCDSTEPMLQCFGRLAAHHCEELAAAAAAAR